MAEIFHLIFYQPLFNALIFFYQTIAFQDLGVAIILLTVAIRVILYPLFYRTYKHQRLMQKIQPHVKKIQADHKHDRAKQAEALLALYKEHQVNPFSGFFLILIQLPVLIALYRVFLNEFSADALKSLYLFVTAPADLNSFFLGLLDLSKPNILIVGLAALAQYFQGKVSLPKQRAGEALGPAERMAKQMAFIGPVITVVILYNLASAIGLYWLVTSVFSLGQQYFINRSLDQKDNNHGKSANENQNNS